MDSIVNIPVLFTVIVMAYLAVSMSMPERRFIVSCDEQKNCTNVNETEICATDGNVYQNQCMLDAEIQRRYCEEGKFNPLAKVHDGKCITTTGPP